jgi:3-methyladenine DNA glycosylase AlkD
MMSLTLLQKELRLYSSKDKAEFFPRFFKAGPGEYAEGDKFIGVSVPDCRMIAKKYLILPFSDIQKLLRSEIHEERLVALLILVENYKLGDRKTKEKIFNFYLKNTKYINNWDLVDLSSYKIIGEYLFENSNCTTTFKGENLKGSRLLEILAKSDVLWDKRIAIISTFAFIRNNKFDPALRISKILLNDKHDLIHKAVGWMLREVGKRSRVTEEAFLNRHYKNMPRTMLRYAIEKFPEEKRKEFLHGNI